MSAKSDHAERCAGALLGCACGDILGAAVEGRSAEEIAGEHGRITDFMRGPRGFGYYTDDTEMTLALAESMVAQGRVDAADASAQYAARFRPWRGYSGATLRILELLRDGADYRRTGRLVFPDGSYGNGACMRIAPVGLAYRHATQEVLRRAVTNAVVATHVHAQAIDAAAVQAAAVAKLSRSRVPHNFDTDALLHDLESISTSGEVRSRLGYLRGALANHESDRRVIDRVGNGLPAAEALAAALWAFASEIQRPEECIIRAVTLGGDTDTIAAMAGALCGALRGTEWIPPRWFDNIENEELGRDQVIALAGRLAELDVRE